MASYSGKFEYLGETGNVMQAGGCRLTVEEAAFRVVPEKGQPLAMDLGDIDVFSPGDCELCLKLYTGKSIRLNYFARAFPDMCAGFLEAYRKRLLQCLLLEDREEIGRFEGHVQFDSTSGPFSSPAQFRIYKSNLAVLPEKASGLNLRLSDINGVEFDEASYRLKLGSDTEHLVITKLARRTGEFIELLRSAMIEVSDNSTRILQEVFPFLPPDRFQALAALMKEGHSTPLSKIAAIDPQIQPALMRNVINDQLKPYIDLLVKLKADCDLYTGFKMVRPEAEIRTADNGPGEAPGSDTDDASPAAPAESASPPEGKDEREQVLHWFFFPIPAGPGPGSRAGVVAWEAASHSGRATYFFRVDPGEGGAEDGIGAGIQRLNRALVMINFRREPVYLPEESLLSQSRYRHYAIACRRLPALRDLRASYIGRAVHSTTEAWQKQVDAVLARA